MFWPLFLKSGKKINHNCLTLFQKKIHENKRGTSLFILLHIGQNALVVALRNNSPLFKKIDLKKTPKRIPENSSLSNRE
jgi:hypothetical protein